MHQGGKSLNKISPAMFEDKGDIEKAQHAQEL